MKEIIFNGDELELLVAMDRIGCVLTDDGEFYCDLENEKLAMGNRLPARIIGTYVSADGGWKIGFKVIPAPRTMLIGGFFVIFCCAMAARFLETGTGSGGFFLSLILCAALAINYAVQHKDCMRRFENAMRK